MEMVSLADFEAGAREALSAPVWDYYFGGANDEVTLRESWAAFDRIRLHNRVLRGVARRDMSQTVLGHRLRLPIIVAPLAMLGMAQPDGDAVAARAASAAGSIFVLSTISTTPVEEVVKATDGPVWFQLYVYKDRAATKALVQRIEAAGCSAIELTVDVPLLGQRERDVRNSFAVPDGLWAPNLTAEVSRQRAGRHEGSQLASTIAAMLDPGLSWDDVTWLRSITSLPVLIKGVVRGDDAAHAVQAGAAAIVVSNHGGRQLDTAPPAVEVLAAVVDAVGGQVEVLVDGGVRRGTDVVKALALGARAVQVGRPVVWGLATAGEQGVTDVLGILHQELDLAMALCGCSSLDEISPDLVRPG
jgi:4-hydroxymandelate oxidase